MHKSLKSALPGLLQLADCIFWEKEPEEYSEFNKALFLLKYAKVPYQKFKEAASQLLETGQVDDELVKELVAENLAIRKILETSSDTPILLMSMLKDISSLMSGNIKAVTTIDKNLSFITGDTSFWQSRDDFRIAVRQRGGLARYWEMYPYFLIEKGYPKDFKGYVDENGHLYTPHKRHIEGVPINIEYFYLNPNYTAKDDTYVFQARAGNAKSVTYFYTTEYKLRSKEQKFKDVKQLSIDIKNIRPQWLKILNTKASEGFEEAVILELIYQTQARIGSSGNATLDKRTGKYLKTYGMSTLLKEHITLNTDGSIDFKYPGKAAFKGDVIHYQTHKFIPEKSNKIISEFIAKRLKDTKSDKLFKTNAEKVRELFSSLGAADGVSVHKLRTLKGTLMMTQAIKSHPFRRGTAKSTQVTKWLREEALQVGIQLGHMSGEKYTATTALQHYIPPQSMIKLYKDLDLVVPKTMAKLAGFI